MKFLKTLLWVGLFSTSFQLVVQTSVAQDNPSEAPATVETTESQDPDLNSASLPTDPVADDVEDVDVNETVGEEVGVPVGDQEYPIYEDPSAIDGGESDFVDLLVRDPEIREVLNDELKSLILQRIRRGFRDVDGIDSAGHSSVFAASSAATATKLKLLIFADTEDSGIGDGAKSNVLIIKNLIETEVSGFAQFSHKIIDGRNFTTRGVRNGFSGLNVDSQTVVFCYFACHGSTDSSGRHYLYTQDSAFQRSDILELISGLNARQAILFTDSCANLMPVPRVESVYSAATSSHVLRALLLRGKGIVSINGASKGEKGWYLSTGGLATLAFNSVASKYRPTDGKISWSRYLKETNKYLKRDFDANGVRNHPEARADNQTSQTASFFKN